MQENKLKEIVVKYVGAVSDEEINKALDPAKQKLKRIIEREGDLEGKRTSLKYFAILVSEEIKARRFSNLCLQSVYNI